MVRGGAGAPGRRPRVFFGESAAVVAAWAAARLVRAAASSTLCARRLGLDLGLGGPDLGLTDPSCRRACAGVGRRRDERHTLLVAVWQWPWAALFAAVRPR